MLPSGAIETDRAPAVTLTVGSPKRTASAGVRASPLRPFSSAITEPSGKTVSFAGPDMFSVMVLPVSRFVADMANEPVAKVVMDPSEAFSTLTNSLLTGKVIRTSNPQNAAGRVIAGGAGETCHLGPLASAGEVITTPPNMPSSAPSATITPSRLMAITPPSPWWRVGACAPRMQLRREGRICRSRRIWGGGSLDSGAQCLALLGGAQAGVFGEGGGLHPVGHAELAQDVGDVNASGPGADVQLGADLRVGASRRKQAQHRQLSFGEPVGRRRRRRALALGRSGVERDPGPLRDGADLREQRRVALCRCRGRPERGGCRRGGLAGGQLRLGATPPGVPGAVRAAEVLPRLGGRAPRRRVAGPGQAGALGVPGGVVGRDGSHEGIAGERDTAHPVQPRGQVAGGGQGGTRRVVVA